MKNILIVDDQSSCRGKIKEYVFKFYPDFNVVQECSSNTELKEYLGEHAHLIDIAFLDIELSDGLVFESLNAFGGDLPFKIVFTTGFQEYALKAFSYSASDYLLKPITEQHLVQSINKIEKDNLSQFYSKQIETIQNTYKKEACKPESIFISTHQKLQILSIKEIVWVQAHSSYAEFIMNNGEKVLASKPLKDFTALLEDHKFIRIHNSYIVNKDFISCYNKTEGGSIEMSNGKHLPISRRRKDDVLEQIKN